MTIEALARSCKNMPSEAAILLNEAYDKYESSNIEKPHPVRGEILRALAETCFSSGDLGTFLFYNFKNSLISQTNLIFRISAIFTSDRFSISALRKFIY